jgi:protoporphyrin/coproporphyrin ferrochelatase
VSFVSGQEDQDHRHVNREKPPQRELASVRAVEPKRQGHEHYHQDHRDDANCQTDDLHKPETSPTDLGRSGSGYVTKKALRKDINIITITLVSNTPADTLGFGKATRLSLGRLRAEERDTWGPLVSTWCARAGSEDRDLRGVLLLAYGGPSSLEDIPAFLERVRGGRPSSQELLDAVRERYRFIGGASPLPRITRSTASKLEQACGYPVYVGMLHWHPFLEETISRMVQDGISEALVICLVPHFSDCSVGRYQRRTAAAAQGQGLAYDFVEDWHLLPPYIEGLVDSVVVAWSTLGREPGDPDQAGDRSHVIFSAHSLPKAALPAGDPYEQQLRETAERVAQRLGLQQSDWTVAYQSASGPGHEWLGPAVDEIVPALAERGVRQAVICPIGFVADQVETLFDLDVVTKQKADDVGVTVARTALLNDGPAVVESLALLVERWAA